MGEGQFTGRWAHGGDVYRNEVRCDFSVSVNPLGMPAEAKRVYREAERRLQQYPDPENEALAQAISRRYGVPKEEILCGTGASGLLTAAVMAVRPERVMLAVPSFSGYRFAIRAAETATGRGIITNSFELREEDGFVMDGRFLRQLSENRQSPDLLILCNPNNPTGRGIEPEILRNILQCCREKRIRFLLDECFLELLPGGEKMSLKEELPHHPELMILNSVTKTYGMPGIRAGWLFCSDRELVRRIERILPEWSVSVPAQETAGAVLSADQEEFLVRSREFVRKERRFLEKGLKRCGCTVYPGSANFLFFSTEKEIAAALLARGILIRPWTEDTGSDGKYFFRIAVRRHAENVMLIKTLEELL
ncbi:MAG: aminotransferase class I/II-fold pyridoxal phosphate-dependent enzyme [Stomatobaculum sp.]|nr:aminotransferase class I/II-fold pyridoxal phosphate-dependent enzyme [Stomatobaculum sp.]